MVLHLYQHGFIKNTNFLLIITVTISDTDDWAIDQNSFETIYKTFGTVTLDRFANNLNKKVSNFNSKYYCPGTCGVNCFTKNWPDSNLY